MRKLRALNGKRLSWQLNKKQMRNDSELRNWKLFKCAATATLVETRMDLVYREAANVIELAKKKKGNIKGLCFASSYKNKKKLYALVCQTIKCKLTNFFVVQRWNNGPKFHMVNSMPWIFVIGRKKLMRKKILDFLFDLWFVLQLFFGKRITECLCVQIHESRIFLTWSIVASVKHVCNNIFRHALENLWKVFETLESVFACHGKLDWKSFLGFLNYVLLILVYC